MSKNIFYLIKTWALISDSSFYNVELLTFSTGVNTRCQSNMSSIKRLLHHIRGKIINILTQLGHLYAPIYTLFD